MRSVTTGFQRGVLAYGVVNPDPRLTQALWRVPAGHSMGLVVVFPGRPAIPADEAGDYDLLPEGEDPRTEEEKDEAMYAWMEANSTPESRQRNEKRVTAWMKKTSTPTKVRRLTEKQIEAEEAKVRQAIAAHRRTQMLSGEVEA